ncbi:MAG TPA: IS66 family transposase [Pseudomonadota bacterium]|nr:IS66 family transposase [Pseudomonadota bacterium]
MLRLEQITDSQQLRQVAELLESENRRLHKRLALLVEEVAALKGKSGTEQLQLELMKLQEQMATLQHRMFGRSSEKRPHCAAEGASDPSPPPPRHGHGPREQPLLPTLEKHHSLPESERTCLVCRGQMEPLGEQTEDAQEITVVERRFVLVTHKRHKYRCRCNAQVQTAPGPLKLQCGGRYSLEFAIQVALDKYAYHLPLERQVRMMTRLGLQVDSQTLWDQIQALERLLKPAYALVHAHILCSEVLYVDETPWALLKKGGSQKWYAWGFATEEAVYYHIDPSRGAKVPMEVLPGYEGVVMVDGYVSYQTLARSNPKLVLAHCMAHCRRKYLEALPAYPQCEAALGWIKELYEIERGLPKLRGLVGPERAKALQLRAQVRQEQSAPRMDALRAWALEQSALRDSLLDKAISYMLSLWTGLRRFVEDPRLEIDNNLVERDLRGCAVGRKNHYGSKSLRGTQVAATLYTLVETASRSGMDPGKYLLAAARHALRNPGAPALLPWDKDGVEASLVG